MLAAAQAPAPLHAAGPCPDARPSGSTSSSGWSSGTLEQLPALCLPALKPVPGAPGGLSRQALVAAAAGQPAAAGGQPWQLQLRAPAIAGTALAKTDPAASMDWQHSLGFNGGAVVTAAATQQQQQQQQAFPGCGPAATAVAAAAAAEPDPWCSGLDLMAANSAADDALPLLDLTDAGLDALLAPFEEWPCMLQPPAAGPPAGAAAAPALQPAAPAQAPLPACHASPAPSSQLQAAAAASPRCSSGTSPSCTAAEAASGGAGGKAPRRKGGRPRIHHPRTPPAAAAGAATVAVAPAGSSGTMGGSASGVQHYKQGGRGPKPKYVFATQEEAADARRERNRKAALESYYKKKERTAQLTSEVAALQAENAALQSLLLEMHTTGLCPLAEASQDGIDAWLKAAGCCAAAATAAAPAGADASSP